MTDDRNPLAHAVDHQHGGGDEVAVAAPAANAIPKALGTGKLDDGWVNLPVFGEQQQLGSGPARTTTTLAAFQLKVQLIIPAFTGTARIRWGCDVDNNNAAFQGEVRLRDVTGAADLDGPVPYGGSGAIPLDDARYKGGTVDVAMAGVAKTVELQFRDVAGGNVQGIARAFLEAFRAA